LKALWRYGVVSQANYFRSVGDVWSRLGFAWPVDRSGRQLASLPPEAAGKYLTKYLTKEKKQWSHKVRATRNLGLTRLRQVVAMMSSELIEQLVARPVKWSQLLVARQRTGVPLGLLRRTSMRELWSRAWVQNIGIPISLP